MDDVLSTGELKMHFLQHLKELNAKKAEIHLKFLSNCQKVIKLSILNFN